MYLLFSSPSVYWRTQIPRSCEIFTKMFLMKNIHGNEKCCFIHLTVYLLEKLRDTLFSSSFSSDFFSETFFLFWGYVKRTTMMMIKALISTWLYFLFWRRVLSKEISSSNFNGKLSSIAIKWKTENDMRKSEIRECEKEKE